MKVIYKIQWTPSPPPVNKEIIGELISLGSDRIAFTPDTIEKTNERFIIFDPKFVIGGEQDDDCIWIRGLVEEGTDFFGVSLS